jgi:glycine betaine/proline transport system substrate-binding protein
LVEIPLDDIATQNALMAAGEDSEADIRRHAEAWIGSHRDQVDQWLDAARAAANN